MRREEEKGHLIQIKDGDGFSEEETSELGTLMSECFLEKGST